MPTLASTAGDAAYWALAVFLVAIGLASAYMLFRLGQTFQRLSSFIRGTEKELLPVINKTGGTVDRVNYELDKLDTVTDSAVSMADSADTAVRAVSTAISKPVEKVSGLAAGISHGFSQFRRSKDFGSAKDAAKEAARQREADLHHDLRVTGRTPMDTERPEPQPRPDPQPKPDPWPRPTPVPKPDPDAAAGRRAPGRRVTPRAGTHGRRLGDGGLPSAAGARPTGFRSCSGTRSASAATAPSSTWRHPPSSTPASRRSRSTRPGSATPRRSHRSAYAVDRLVDLLWALIDEIVQRRRPGLADPRVTGGVIGGPCVPALATAGIPTLVLLATEARAARDAAAAARMRAAFPAAELRPVEGMRHAVFADLGAEIGVLASDWLREAVVGAQPGN